MVPSWSKRWLNMYTVITHYMLQYNIGKIEGLKGLRCQKSSTHFNIRTSICPQSPPLAVILMANFVFVCYSVYKVSPGENVPPKDVWYSSQSSSPGTSFSFCALYVAHAHPVAVDVFYFSFVHFYLTDWYKLHQKVWVNYVGPVMNCWPVQGVHSTRQETLIVMSD